MALEQWTVTFLLDDQGWELIGAGEDQRGSLGELVKSIADRGWRVGDLTASHWKTNTTRQFAPFTTVVGYVAVVTKEASADPG